MSQNSNPLTDDLLDGAQYLCLHDAASTDCHQIPFGSGNIRRFQLHEMRDRFNEARKRLSEGITEVTELGLRVEDCTWAVAQAPRAKDHERWKVCFEQAEEALKQNK